MRSNYLPSYCLPLNLVTGTLSSAKKLISTTTKLPINNRSEDHQVWSTWWSDDAAQISCDNVVVNTRVQRSSPDHVYYHTLFYKIFLSGCSPSWSPLQLTCISLTHSTCYLYSKILTSYNAGHLCVCVFFNYS